MTGPVPARPRRPDGAHKGTFGTVAIVGGRDDDAVMPGAPALAARAALRTGCGRVIIAAPRSALGEVLTICPEATGCALPQDDAGMLLVEGTLTHLDELASTVGVMAVGPGLGATANVEELVAALIARDGVPLVLDADALTAVSRRPGSWPARRGIVLTPHPGEFARLAGAVGILVPGDDPAQRTAAAQALADALDAVVVLKGHGTVVAVTGEVPWTCAEGGVELSVAGTGDVLTGVIASLIAQRGPDDLAGSARLGVSLHARAGALWRSEHGDRGLLAHELADALSHLGD